MRFAWAYRPAWYLGVGALALALVLGVYQSWRAEHRPPGLSFANVDEIQALLDAGRTDEAIPRLEMSLRLVTRNRHVIHNLLGRALQGEQRYAGAADHYRQAVALRPDFVEGHNNLGIVLARDEDWLPAIAAFRQALRLDPGFEPASRNLALAIAGYDRSAPAAADPANAQLLAEARLLIGRAPGSAPAAAAPSAAIVRGRQRVAAFYSADLAGLSGQFSRELAGRMGPERLSAFRQQVVNQLGRETELLREQVGAAGPASYSRWSRFERFDGIVELTFVENGSGEIQDFRIRLGETEG